MEGMATVAGGGDGPDDPDEPGGAEAESFPRFYHRLRLPLVRLSVAMVGDADEADEVVQAAMAVTADRYDHLDDPETHVVNHVLDGCQQVGWVDEPTSERGPLLDALGLVPAHERVALAMHQEEALSPDIVAAAFDLPAENLRALRAKAVVKLQEGDPSADVDAALAADLDAAVAGLPESRAALHDVRQRMFGRRRRRVGIGAGIAAAVLAALVVFLVTRDGGDDDPEAGDTTEVNATAATTTSPTTAPGTTPATVATTTAPTTTVVAGPARYVVEEGDAWFAIAEKLGVPLETLLAANNMTAETVLFPGQELIVPQVEATGGTEP
jgi:DNA-directed RNA polymerase specialized sigma24 family protein/LysM repeat protein